MVELLENAWTGWLRIADGGKLVALFLVALLFLWIGRKQEKQKNLLRYGIVSAVCCILPVTAVALMLYQTRFYDYEWIWSIVPVTVVTAYAGTKVLAGCWQGFRREAWRKGLPVTLGLLAIVYVCGGLGGTDVGREAERARRAEAENVLEALKRDNTDVCIWAPRKVMEYARRLDGSILLPYGRNMWEEALGAYSFDVYSKGIENMYQWMCIVEETLTEEDYDRTDEMAEKMAEQQLTTGECLDTARQAGVDVLILPANTNEALLNEVIKCTGVQPRQNSGYYFFSL